jgi:nitrous oxide reductase
MPDVSRRNFLRNASLGAAATGVVALGGAGLFQAATSAGAVPLASQGDNPSAPALEGTDIFAHVVDAKAGRITLFVGTKEVSYIDQGLAQRILRAAQ